MAQKELESSETAEAFAEYIMTTPGPDGSPNTNEEWITKGQVMDFWDTAIMVTQQSLEARDLTMDESDEKAMVAWWASGAIQGFMVAMAQNSQG